MNIDWLFHKFIEWLADLLKSSRKEPEDDMVVLPSMRSREASNRRAAYSLGLRILKIELSFSIGLLVLGVQNEMQSTIPDLLPTSLRSLDLANLRRFIVVGFMLSTVSQFVVSFRHKADKRIVAVLIVAASAVIITFGLDGAVSARVDKLASNHYISVYRDATNLLSLDVAVVQPQTQDRLRAALAQLEAVRDRTESPRLQAELSGYIAGAELYLGSPRDSALQYAELMSTFPESRTPGNVKSLHWALYRYWKATSDDVALQFYDGLRGQYRQVPLSRLWLAVSPTAWEAFEAGNPRGLLEESRIDRPFIRRITELDSTDDDYYLGLFLSERHLELLEMPVSTPYRDWSVYRLGQAAFEQDDYQGASQYFSRFSHEYQHHQWRGDSVLMLGLSYEAAANYRSAVDALLPEAKGLDDKSPAITRLLLAILDIHFDSTMLTKYVQERASTLSDGELRFMTYCLAEQLFKERAFERARDLFVDIQKSAPSSDEGQLSDHNLTILSKIIPLAASGQITDVLSLSNLYSSDSGLWDEGDLGTEHLIVYNDLYDGRRRVALQSLHSVEPAQVLQLNDFWQSNQIIDAYYRSHPLEIPLAEAMYAKALNLYRLTYRHSFTAETLYIGAAPFDYPQYLNRVMDENGARAAAAQRLLLADLAVLADDMAKSLPTSGLVPSALELSGVAYANAYAASGDDLFAAQAERIMIDLAGRFPAHHTANNALIFAARLDVRRAQHPYQDDSTGFPRMMLERAVLLYRRVLDSYPDGHVGSEANVELKQAESALLNLGN